MLADIFGVLSAILMGGIIIFIVIYLILSYWTFKNTLVSNEQLRADTNALKQELHRVISKNITEGKKQKFLAVPSVSFHFADKEKIRDFYNDYFREPILESLVSEIAGEKGAQVNASFPQLFGLSFGGKGTNKRISTIRPSEVSLAGMFLQYQREIIKNDQVVLGLEEVDIELSELRDFEKLIQNLDKRFGLNPDPELVDSIKIQLKEKAADKTLIKLEQATGLVLVEGRFKITRNGDSYICTYTHPVNEYLSAQNKRVTITVSVEANHLEPAIAGNYAQSVEKHIPLKIYGNVWLAVDRKTDTWELQLTPFAIYQ